MKKRIILFLTFQITALFIFTVTNLYAWGGDAWGPISREMIIRTADEMVDFSWTPLNTMNNWVLGGTWETFSSGTTYKGIAYSQNNPQENWSDFYWIINNTSGGDTYYGNDCSGFVSMSWKLPVRYTTADFEYDATNSGGYVTSLGDVGSGEYVNLLRGDAFVSTSKGHILLFEKYQFDGQGIKTGIEAMEQSTYPYNRAVRTKRYNKWTDLSTYRPIRRNNIEDYVFTTKWGSYGSTDGQFNEPTSIAVDSSGDVYVIDSNNSRIQKFSSSGNFITKWGSYGAADGQFYHPRGIAVDLSGNVYVADTFDHRIQKFTSNGGFITKWGYRGSGNVEFILPSGVAVDSSGNIYVADSGNHRIQKFTSSGIFITKWGESGSGDSQFYCPHGIAVDSSDNVYVADSCNDRIQKFTSNGTYITKWGSTGSGDAQFQYPAGLAVDLSGNVLVADTDNHRIQKFSSNGGFITKWGLQGSGDGQFSYPSGTTIDSSGNVYVADEGNDRIQKFFGPTPDGPSNLIANALSPGQINLSWQDNSNNETGFRIKRKAGDRGEYTTIATVNENATSFIDASISIGTTNYYAVWAYNSAGDSVYADEAVIRDNSVPVAGWLQNIINLILYFSPMEL